MLHMSMQAHLAQKQALVVTPQLQQAIKLLALNNIELSCYAETLAEENPFIEVLVPQAARAMPRAAGLSAEARDYDPTSLIEDLSAETFHAQVFKQVDEILVAPADRAIGYALASHLEPSGWLLVPLDGIARNLGVDEEVIARVLAKLHSAEPRGLFARGLKECLRLQIPKTTVNRSQMSTLIDHLELVQQGSFPELRRMIGCSKSELSQLLRLLRKLDPKPGLQLSHGNFPPIREPDLRAFKDANDEWVVELNNSTLPTIAVDETLARRVRKLVASDSDREFVRGSLGTARWFTRAIAQRNETSIKVAAEIVRYQKAFLEHGMQHMRPLKLKTIAEAVGVHESTISRVTSSMMMQVPHGCFPLKIFFSAAIDSNNSEEGASAHVVRERIRTLIQQEPRHRPLSDDKITRRLHDEGFHVARRTVAKYRKLDRIPSSSQRCRSYNLVAAL
jgi:RNA polymerase sigma-54 factor